MLLLFLQIAAKGQQVLKKDYFFFTEEGFHQLKQSNDTLYTYRCSKDFSYKDENSRFKIMSVKKLGNHSILKLERLGLKPQNQILSPDDRYPVLALKDVNEKTLSYIIEAQPYTKNEIDTLQIKQTELDEKFGFTYYSKPYLTELGKRRQITVRKEIENIIKLMNKPEYQAIINTYRSSKVIDMYASGLTSELWHRAVIESGYSPIGAREKFNQLMR